MSRHNDPFPYEPYCCTCGKNQVIDKPRKSDNASTMCDDCVDEIVNYCCKCGHDLRRYTPKKTISLCSDCYFDLCGIVT